MGKQDPQNFAIKMKKSSYMRLLDLRSWELSPGLAWQFVLPVVLMQSNMYSWSSPNFTTDIPWVPAPPRGLRSLPTSAKLSDSVSNSITALSYIWTFHPPANILILLYKRQQDQSTSLRILVARDKLDSSLRIEGNYVAKFWNILLSSSSPGQVKVRWRSGEGLEGQSQVRSSSENF